MKEEIDTIKINETWQLVDLPMPHDTIGVKWTYRLKYNPDGSIKKQKARLVVKRYAQQYGVDYFETFSLVARFEIV